MKVKLPNGTLWPRPYIESDDYSGPAWKVWHSPETLTKQDLNMLANYAEAYEYLIFTTQQNRNYVCRQIRRAVLVDKNSKEYHE